MLYVTKALKRPKWHRRFHLWPSNFYCNDHMFSKLKRDKKSNLSLDKKCKQRPQPRLQRESKVLSPIVCSNDVTAAMLEEQTKKRQPSWRCEIFFWGINSIFMQITPFVSLCKYGSWSHERTHSYQTYLCIYVARVTQQRLNHLRVSFVNSDMQW